MARFQFARRSTKAATARKTQVGTSYQSKGLDNAPKPNIDNEAGSSQPIIIRDLVPELSNAFSRASVYAKMMRDAAVDVSIRSAKTPILGAEFFVDPFSDDPLDLEVSEFITANLMEGMSAPFLNSLEDVLHLYEDGYSVVEKVYEEREWAPRKLKSSANTKNFIMLKKLAPRPTGTIKEISYDDNGGPESIIQNAIRKENKTEEQELPITSIIIFTFNRQGGDLTGKSLLRTAYPHWYYKTHFYKIDSIQKERHSIGVPKGKLLPGYTPQDKLILRQLLRNLRTNEESFILETPAIEIGFAEMNNSGNLPNALESASHHNSMILMNVLAQFIGLGVEGGGGRATAGTQSDLFMKSLRFVANYIADQINMYVIPELVVWNYPTKNFPKLKVRNIGETRDLQMLAAALANLFAQQALTNDDDTENWLREVFDMPAKKAGSVSRAPKDVVSNNGSSTNGKGDVKLEKGTGNVGKPVNAAT